VSINPIIKFKNPSIDTNRNVNPLGSPYEENEEGLEHGEKTNDYSNVTLQNAPKSIQNDKRDAYKTRVAFDIPGSTPEDYVAIQYMYSWYNAKVFSVPKEEMVSNRSMGHQMSRHPEKNDPRSIIKT
jgi:hypothetical protein